MTDDWLELAVHGLAYAGGMPPACGVLRRQPDDFRVTELPSVEPGGSGEHVWLWIRKRSENTDHVAMLLSRLAGVHPRNIGYAGQKDRHAVTEQWFSVHLPGRAEPDWQGLDSDTITVLRHARHGRKLQRGTLSGNEFVITVRDIAGSCAELEERLQRVGSQGVPNYFGAQRFGNGGGNLRTATQLFANPRMKLSRNRRSMALSAARSLLFNRVLSRRVSDGSWNAVLPGDAMQLAGSHSFFVVDTVDAELLQRLASHDIHATGPLAGSGDSPVRDACRVLEAEVLAEFDSLAHGLATVGLKQERRALRLPVAGLCWQWLDETTLELAFGLPAGCYATSVLRELVREK
ncbi:MAG: tRNA pseudouridine(13) synthase TruD [Gammaproteobacteria bacterium]